MLTFPLGLQVGVWRGLRVLIGTRGVESRESRPSRQRGSMGEILWLFSEVKWGKFVVQNEVQSQEVAPILLRDVFVLSVLSCTDTLTWLCHFSKTPQLSVTLAPPTCITLALGCYSGLSHYWDWMFFCSQIYVLLLFIFPSSSMVSGAQTICWKAFVPRMNEQDEKGSLPSKTVSLVQRSIHIAVQLRGSMCFITTILVLWRLSLLRKDSGSHLGTLISRNPAATLFLSGSVFLAKASGVISPYGEQWEVRVKREEGFPRKAGCSLSKTEKRSKGTSVKSVRENLMHDLWNYFQEC